MWNSKWRRFPNCSQRGMYLTNSNRIKAACKSERQRSTTFSTCTAAQQPHNCIRRKKFWWLKKGWNTNSRHVHCSSCLSNAGPLCVNCWNKLRENIVSWWIITTLRILPSFFFFHSSFLFFSIRKQSAWFSQIQIPQTLLKNGKSTRSFLPPKSFFEQEKKTDRKMGLNM